MRETTLKRSLKGFYRSIGKRPDGTQPKFMLGHDKIQAEKKLSAIIALWKTVEFYGGWTKEAESTAKAIAKGTPAVLNKRDGEHPGEFFRRLNALSEIIPISPKHPIHLEDGRDHWEGELAAVKAKLFGEENKHKDLTGQTLFLAIEAFRQSLLTKEGDIKDGEKTLADQLKSLPSYLTDCDLGNLDFMATDECYGVFRNRPVTKRYKKRMTRKSARNLISALNQFFKWLHLHNAWNWRKPDDFGEISRKIVDIEGDDEHDAEEHEVWTIEELKVLYRYALPIERAFMLLGLNCSYGADQIGTLRESRVYFREGKRAYIKRIRKKRGTWSVHLLFEQTEKILRWAQAHRQSIESDSPYLLVNSQGKPYWYLTKNKNRSMQIPSAWRRLLNRVKKDYKDFRQLPFNSLRDTSSDMIEKMGGSDFASLHLAHKHLSGDKSLRNYVNPNRSKHFKLIRRLERKLSSIWEGIAITDIQSKNYVGFAKVELIKKLRAEGVSQEEVAKKVGVSKATVSRHAPKYRVPKKRMKKLSDPRRPRKPPK
jgi:predicted DNA-binding protein (UPF0251 family)